VVVGGGLAGLAAAHPAALGATRGRPRRTFNSGLISEKDGPVKRHKSAVRGGVDPFRAGGPGSVANLDSSREESG
jgi:hypothetical protein